MSRLARGHLRDCEVKKGLNQKNDVERVELQSVAKRFHRPAMLAVAGDNGHTVKGRGESRNREGSGVALIVVELAAEATNLICLRRDAGTRLRWLSSRVKGLEFVCQRQRQENYEQ